MVTSTRAKRCVQMQYDCNDAVILHVVGEPVKHRPGTLRAARVADTEERLLTAARELFVRDGYAATTLTAVADVARVGHRTVYVRFGTKAALLKRVVDVAVVGDQKPIPLSERDWAVAALDAPTLEDRIDVYTRGASELMGRIADVIAVALQAERDEPLLAEAAQAGRLATRESLRRFVTKLREGGLINGAIDLEWLVDTLGIIGQAQTYLLARQTLDWNPDDYRGWLRTTLHHLLASGGPDSAAPAARRDTLAKG